MHLGVRTTRAKKLKKDKEKQEEREYKISIAVWRLLITSCAIYHERYKPKQTNEWTVEKINENFVCNIFFNYFHAI